MSCLRSSKCDTEEQGDEYWCVVKDDMAPRGFRRFNCSESFPWNTALTEVKLSPEEIIRVLKKNPIVFSMIERGRDYMDYIYPCSMTKVGKIQENILS